MQVTRLIHFGHIMAAGRKKPGLNPQQARFCVEYVKDHNATKAAIRSGYSAHTAESQGSRLLTHVEVAERITTLDKAVEEKVIVTKAEILNGLKNIAALDLRKLYDANGVLLPVKDWPDEIATSLQGVKTLEEFEKSLNGSMEKIGETKEIKLGDRKAAWDLLGKHLKLWSDTTVNVNLSLEDLVNKSFEDK